MNKKLLAIAVAGALAAPLAAQAGGPTVYGKIHVSIDSIDHEVTAGGARDSTQTQISSQSSRFGIKGDEDLGNGMKAIYKLESSIDVTVDENTGSLGARNRYVGLSGGFGTVLTGYHDYPVKSVGRKVDLFPEMIGDNRNILQEVTSEADNRAENAIMYRSPKMNGFGVDILYSADTNQTANVDDNDLDAWSASATYANGPLFVGFGYLDNNVTASTDEQVWRLSASYKFGAFKVVGLYQDVDDGGGTAGNDNEAWGLGGAYTFGNNTIKAQYYSMDDVGSTANSGADMFALGIDHKFSKRTMVYAAYADTDNDASQDAGMNSGGRTDDNDPSTGRDQDGFSLGIIHNF